MGDKSKGQRGVGRVPKWLANNMKLVPNEFSPHAPSDWDHSKKLLLLMREYEVA